MTTFERTYRELERLKGVSLHKETLLYKVEPEPERTWENGIVPLAADANPEPPKKRFNWRPLLLLILAFGLAAWVWFEALN